MEIPDKSKKISNKIIQGPVINETLEALNYTTPPQKLETEKIISNLSYQQNFKELMTGYIPKKTMNMAWTQRYFTLTPTRLIYYTSKQKDQVKGCFNLISLQEHNISIVEQFPILTLSVSVKSSKLIKEEKELLKLNIENKNQFQRWRIGIKAILENRQNFNPKLYPSIHLEAVRNPQPKVTSVNFWNKITLSMNELCSYANHLDIIFFRSKNPSSYIQRLFMRSYYDHVGLLLKNEVDELFILQAIESRGVWANSFSELLPSLRDVYEEVGYRKLQVPKNLKIDEVELQNYLNSLVGKRYELTLAKLISSEDQTENEEDSNKTKKEKTYFCSELIADIYIKFGLIKDRKKNDFWPRDFENSLKLESGATLSPLMEIQLT